MVKYPSYQITEYDWLQTVPSHWQKKSIRGITQLSDERLGEERTLELLSVYRDYGVIKKSSRDDNHNVESLNLSNYKVVEKDYLVMNKMKMWQGSLGVSGHGGIVSPAYIVCKFKIDANYRYLHYLLRSASFKTQYNRISYGIRVGQWDMRYNDFKNINLYLPSRPEQNQIVKFLDAKISKINKFINAKKREIELLKEQIEFLCFNEFADSCKIESWNNSFDDSWKKVKAKRIFEEITVKNKQSEELLAVTQNNGVIYKKDSTKNFVSPSGSLESLKLVQKGDFVISLRSFQGGIEYSNIQGIVSPAYNVFRLKPKYNNPVLREFFKHLFKTNPFIELLRTLGGGIRDGKNISFSEFSEFYIPFPSEIHLMTIEHLSKKYEALRQQQAKLFDLMIEYQVRLINDVVAGKIDVRHITIYDTLELAEIEAIDDEVEEELPIDEH